MHNRDKYPEIWASFERAKEELAPLKAARKIKMTEMNDIAREMDVLRTAKGKKHDEACVDIEKIRELSKVVSRLAKAMGAKSA